MKRLQVVPLELIEKFLQDIDPFNNQKITFSECVHLLSTEMVRRKEDGREMAVLEALAVMDHTTTMGGVQSPQIMKTY
jgi:hypothetical protein